MVSDCAQQALAAGLDLTACTAVQNAADVRDLMRVLPYDGWNIFGVSYGPRVALVTVRDAPAGIRSVILDSTTLPSTSTAPSRDTCCTGACCRTIPNHARGDG